MRYLRIGSLLVLAFLLLSQLGASTVGAAEVVHIVSAGENLTRIALRYGSTVPAIAAANGIANPNRIYVGQRLVIPATSASVTTTTTTTTTVTTTSTVVAPTTGLIYTVQRGDTLFRIAQRFGSTVPQLAALNGIANPNLIYVGQRLRLTGAVTVTTRKVTTTTQQVTTTGQPTGPQAVCGGWQTPRVLIERQGGGVASISVSWASYPGAVWYKLYVSGANTVEYLLKEVGRHVPVSDLSTVGAYRVQVFALDQSFKSLCQSPIGGFSVDRVAY